MERGAAEAGRGSGWGGGGEGVSHKLEMFANKTRCETPPVPYTPSIQSWASLASLASLTFLAPFFFFWFPCLKKKWRRKWGGGGEEFPNKFVWMQIEKKSLKWFSPNKLARDISDRFNERIHAILNDTHSRPHTETQIHTINSTHTHTHIHAEGEGEKERERERRPKFAGAGPR